MTQLCRTLFHRQGKLSAVGDLQLAYELDDLMQRTLSHLRLGRHVAKVPMMLGYATFGREHEGGIGINGQSHLRKVRCILSEFLGMAEMGCMEKPSPRQYRSDDHRPGTFQSNRKKWAACARSSRCVKGWLSINPAIQVGMTTCNERLLMKGRASCKNRFTLAVPQCKLQRNRAKFEGRYQRLSREV